jgi:hypothetical protein
VIERVMLWLLVIVVSLMIAHIFHTQSSASNERNKMSETITELNDNSDLMSRQIMAIAEFINERVGETQRARQQNQLNGLDAEHNGVY